MAGRAPRRRGHVYPRVFTCPRPSRPLCHSRERRLYPRRMVDTRCRAIQQQRLHATPLLGLRAHGSWLAIACRNHRGLRCHTATPIIGHGRNCKDLAGPRIFLARKPPAAWLGQIYPGPRHANMACRLRRGCLGNQHCQQRRCPPACRPRRGRRGGDSLYTCRRLVSGHSLGHIAHT